ncbi:aldo/keto reductase [Micromonospora zamorensis]|uniref:aldo/keto reductase n=1 Tax=Micromonospora zamorensis TaxID=709883 RepID=UPI003D97DBB9
MDISVIGLGAWAIGGAEWRYGWGAQDDRESAATIRRAVEAGANWIDTAPVYGLGHSEELIGRTLAQISEADRPFVFTKCGLVWDEDDRYAPPRRLMTPANVRREVEDSLRRLGVDRIDLYQVHQPDDGNEDVWEEEAGPPSSTATPLEDYWQVMADLKAEGKVRAIGLSNHDSAALERANRIAPVDAIQPMFSAISREAAAEISWADAHHTGVIVYQPMYSGLLSGEFSAERVAALPANDWRRTDPQFTTELDSNLAVAATLRMVAAEHDVPAAAVAVAWALAWPGVAGAIVGARRPDQVDVWLPAAALSLTEHDMSRIAATISGAGAGGGPVRPPSGSRR